MKYLKKIILKNFQSHKYSIIEFNEGLNIIVGPSDSGKTAIIRALKWVLYNEPSGDYFVREGESQCSVEVEFSDNTKLKRERNKNRNIYELTKSNGKIIKFEGFGSSIPPEITEEIKISKIYLDDLESSTINLGEQLEGAFLLSEKSSVRASAIGRIVGVNIIDDALKETIKDLRNYNINKKNIAANIEESSKELLKYAYLEPASNTLKTIKTIRKSLSNKLKVKNNLIVIKDKHIKLIDESTNLKSELSNYSNLSMLESTLVQIDLTNKNFKYLSLLQGKLAKNKESIETDLITRKMFHNIFDLEVNLNKLSELTLQQKQLNKINIQLNTLIEDLRLMNQIYKRVEDLEYLSYLIESYQNKSKYMELLTIKNKEFTTIISRIVKGDNYLKNFLDLSVFEQVINKINVLLRQIEGLKLKKTSLNTITQEIRYEENFLEETDGKLENLKQEYRKTLAKHEICPFCMNKINKENIDSIIDSY